MKVSLEDIKNFAQGNANYYLEKIGIELKPEIKEQVITRMQICGACPFLGQDTEGPFCTKCGCPYPQLTYAPSKTCPIGKWDKMKKNV